MKRVQSIVESQNQKEQCEVDPAHLHQEEPVKVVQASGKDAPWCLSWKIFWACPLIKVLGGTQDLPEKQCLLANTGTARRDGFGKRFQGLTARAAAPATQLNSFRRCCTQVHTMQPEEEARDKLYAARLATIEHRLYQQRRTK